MRAWLVLIVVAACSKRAPRASDPCPLDDTFEDDWPGCPDEPFSGDMRILGVGNPMPCEKARFDTSGFALGTRTFDLDPAGRLASSTEHYSGGGTSKTTYQRDPAGRVIAVDHEGGVTAHWDYERDASGHLTRVTMHEREPRFGPMETTYQRDAAAAAVAIDHHEADGSTSRVTQTWSDGQLVRTSRENTDAAHHVTRTDITATHDDHGRRSTLSRVTDGKETTVRYHYSMSGRLDLINDGTTSTTVIHDEQGRVVEIHAADRITRYGYCR